ncbi:MAG: alkylhydroperoxidase [Alteromonas sp. Nap_26]|nr:MAG: alkylhydroperoxidase [Alteromonas sp. Nap_26]
MLERISQTTFYKHCPNVVAQLSGLTEFAESSPLTPSLLHLVRLRASQINRCGFCQKMHADEARRDGETQDRLDVLAAWRELSCFTAQERVALAWTEALTLVCNSEITEDIYQNTLEAFGQQGLLDLTMAIVQINSWNRISVSLCFQPDIEQRGEQ